MIDDQTVAYTLTAQTYFEDLKQVASQLAGMLVLAAAGSRNEMPIALAEQAYKQAVDGLRSARVPVPARVHHDHLLAAAAKLDEALHGSGDPLIPLESAYAELRGASRALPGFQMISFERGCCAA
jgi:hypothetical protein